LRAGLEEDGFGIFIRCFTALFGHNLAEHDVRIVKVKQKISGCFRSDQGETTFSLYSRDYIATVRKQGHNVFSAVNDVFNGAAVQ